MEKHNVTKKKYINILLTLFAVMVMPFYLYGTRVLVLLITSLITAVVTDFICIRISGKKNFERYDFSCIITALIIVLLLPATVPFWIVIVSVVIALAIAKNPFGGTGFNIFNPAAVGLAFVAICWPQYVLRYPVPFSTIGVTDETTIQYATSFESILKVGGTPKIDYFDVLLGKFAGPLGATCIIVLAACLLFLFVRKIISLRIILPALFVVGLFAVVFPRVVTGNWSSLIFEGSSGGLIFGLIFMASDPVTIPKSRNGQVLFGFILGFTIMIFRYFGAVELEFVYAILIANIFAIPCDRYALFLNTKIRKLLDKGKNLSDNNKKVIKPQKVGGAKNA